MTSESQPAPEGETPAETIARLEREARERQFLLPVTPLVPRPIVTVISLLVAVALVGHLFYDAIDKGYDGWKVTGALGLLVFFVLGGDVSKWLRRGG